MKMGWNRILLTALLVATLSSLLLAPVAMAAGHGGMRSGGGMGIRGGTGISGIHNGGVSNIGSIGPGHVRGIHEGFGRRDFDDRFIGRGFGIGGWPWGWNNWGWNNWWGGNWWPTWNDNPCFTDCVAQGLDPGYCSQVCGVY